MTSSSLAFSVCSFARPSGAACFLFLFMVVPAFVNLNMTLLAFLRQLFSG
ncbi:hypothetical protein OROGR_000412 [Orobanche gracilis]